MINKFKQKVKDSQTYSKKKSHQWALWLNHIIGFSKKCIKSKNYGAPAKNRTWISGFGGLRHIHWTTGATEIIIIRIRGKSKGYLMDVLLGKIKHPLL